MASVLKPPFQLKLWQKVIIGMVSGIIFGYIFKEQAIIVKPIGTIFFNMLKMMMIPLVFFVILYGVTSLSDIATLARLSRRAISIYAVTTVFAVTMGLTFANIFKPGKGLNIELKIDPSHHAQAQQTLSDLLISIVPSNPIQAMASGNTLQVVVFALFTGVALILIGDKGTEVKTLVTSVAHTIFKMVEMVIKLTPYGVFALMAWVIGEYGFKVIFGLAKFSLVVLGAMVVQYILFGGMLMLTGLNPLPFYKKMTGVQALAFATASSKATLPTAIADLRRKIGVSKQISAFILPLGASMNMDATAIYLGICTVFFAQMLNIELTMQQYLVVMVTATIGSVGAAGIPGGGVIMMGMVLSSVGLPLEGISLILGVDRFLEMVRTAINITGDCAVTVIVDKMEGSLNNEVYYKEESKLEG